MASSFFGWFGNRRNAARINKRRFGPVAMVITDSVGRIGNHEGQRLDAGKVHAAIVRGFAQLADAAVPQHTVVAINEEFDGGPLIACVVVHSHLRRELFGIAVQLQPQLAARMGSHAVLEFHFGNTQRCLSHLICPFWRRAPAAGHRSEIRVRPAARKVPASCL